jgi:serine/threonine protein kinase
MGAVYQARDTRRQMICAIKEMSLSNVPDDERLQAVQNFKSEAKMLWGLSHPNLPAFYGFFSEGPRYFMVMEYIDGYTLEELLEQNNAPFSERRVLGWARQLCDVLEYLHSQNPPIIFRDMKPGNIMLMRNGRIKLIDFGIARFFRSSHAQDTQLLGTPGFAPPEQYGKSQTDERSDIYSLAMTLFQLLTNTLSETGFGLKDIRAINAQISPAVARALEKAASLAPEERYDNVAAFRRALLGVGMFIFENGDQATTPEELADLCARYPEEAADYLTDGEIESWLRELGENDLARAARQLKATADDPLLAVEQFIQAVMGPQARLRSGVSTTSGRMPAVTPQQSGRGIAGWFSHKPPSLLQITPRSIDFGPVYPGISAPLSFTIAGRQGATVSGTIHATEQWIMVDQSQFDGMSTRVNVRVNTARLVGGTHYAGTVLVSCNEEDTDTEQAVTIDVDVISYSNTTQRRSGKTVGADLDDDEEDDLTMGSGVSAVGGMVMVPPTVKAKTATPASQTAFQSMAANDAEYKAKYGSPSGTASGWDPLNASALQRLWIQRGLTFLAAFMLSSLSYTLVSSLAHAAPIFPSPWAILVLCAIIPAATLGALLVYREQSATLADLLNRACTGMVTVLVGLALVKMAWLAALGAALPSLQCIVVLFVAALAATVGCHPANSARIVGGMSWAIKRMRSVAMAFSVILGAILGFALTQGAPFYWFTPLGILVGVGAAVALVLRVDALLNKKANPHP